jgi:hypothetical protein
MVFVRAWVEMAMAYFMACYFSPDETEETYEKPRISVSSTEI